MSPDYLPLIFLVPLAMAAVNGFFWRRIRGDWPGILASAAVFVSFALALVAWFQLRDIEGEPVIRYTLYEWISAGSFNVPLGIHLDPLSMTWTLVVTGVGLLIHIYAIGYMAHEDHYAKTRFFCYMNLFIFAMLVLVMGSSLPLLFLGWEGVGLCSYLLIAFYYDKQFAADAGKKAFIVNRIGDVAFILAIFWTFVHFGDVRYEELFTVMDGAEGAMSDTTAITGIAILLFVGAMGKSAQIPLYVWLPDAMAGPTPVSALIHAATMVTAGVYMVCRMSPLFSASPIAMYVVALTGCATAVFAGIIGICQRDIKKVLAYSTVSQLGYMFMACGVGAFTAAAFHVTTHAFFKALLFLAAGSVIHSMAGEQDIFAMGALRKKLPRLFLAFAAGSLALVGFIPFAGFFSKDEILWETFATGHYLLYGLGVAAAGVTAFYTFRLVYLAFLGSSRIDPEVEAHIHKPPMSMNIPVYILGILAVVGGFLCLPAVFAHALHVPQYLGDFLAPVFARAHENLAAGHGHQGHEAPVALELGLMALSLIVVSTGLFLGWLYYRHGHVKAKKAAEAVPGLHALVADKFRVDEAYRQGIVDPLKALANAFSRFDLKVIDGLVNLTARIVDIFGLVVRVAHTGVVHSYAFWFIVGALAVFLYVVV